MFCISDACSPTWMYKRDFTSTYLPTVSTENQFIAPLTVIPPSPAIARLSRKSRPSSSQLLSLMHHPLVLSACRVTPTHKQALREAVQLRPYNRVTIAPSCSCFAQEPGMQITDVCRIISDHTIERIAFLIIVQT